VSSSGAASTYTPVAGDAGKYLRATASYTDGHGAGKSAAAVSTNATAASATLGSATSISASITGPSGNKVTSLSPFTITITFGEKVKIEANDISVEEGSVTSGPTATSPDSAGLAKVWTAQVTPARYDPRATAARITEPFNTVVTLIEAAYFTDTKATALATYTVAVDLPLGVVLTADEESWRQGGETVNGYKVNIFFTEPVKSDCGSSDTDACTLNADEVTVANGVARPPWGARQEYVVFVQATGSQDVVLTVGADAVTAASGGEGNTSESITLSGVTVARPSATITGPVPGGGERTATYTSGTPDSLDVTITFNIPVNGLAAGDFDIRGATMAAPVATSPDTAGYAKVWTAAVTPTALGVLSIQLRDGGASASSGKTNTVSNIYAFFTTGSAPQFSASTATLSLNENTRSTPDLKVIAADLDTAIGDKVTYALSGTDAHVFAIQGRQTGVIQVRDVDHVVTTLDYEAKSSYSFVVTATDTEGNTDSIQVTLNVTNVDEPGTATLSNTSNPAPSTPARFPHGTAFVRTGDTLTATLSDPDGSVSDVTWQWEKAKTRSGPYTAIEGATGASYTTTRAENAPEYRFLRATASYTDGHGSGKTAVARAVWVWTILAPPANAPMLQQAPAVPPAARQQAAQQQRVSPSLPAAPSGFAVKATRFDILGRPAGAQLSWDSPDNNADITGWELKVSPALRGWPDQTWTPIPGRGPTTTSHVVTGLRYRAEHTFAVRAVAGEVGEVKGAASTTVTLDTSPRPTNLTATAIKAGVTLEWDDAASHAGIAITGWESRWSVSGWTPWEAVVGHSVSDGRVSFTIDHNSDNRLNPYGEFETYFSIRAVYADGARGAPVGVWATPIKIPRPPPPVANGSVELSWTLSAIYSRAPERYRYRYWPHSYTVDPDGSARLRDMEGHPGRRYQGR
ncbi:MAG: cadherin domain-containing protein, partial [Gammaproteobacteria bacterium]|nr:cadherin domain-containing protein [Gammaproteobacteria bacterium]